MLRITTSQDADATTLHVEGRLAGPLVKELEACCQDVEQSAAGPGLRIDLREVTFIDAAGKNLLACLHRKGAQFVAVECMTRGVIDSIVAERGSERPDIPIGLS